MNYKTIPKNTDLSCYFVHTTIFYPVSCTTHKIANRSSGKKFDFSILQQIKVAD